MSDHITNRVEASHFVTTSRWWTWVALVVVFAAGIGIRLYDLKDPPLDFHPTRQLHSALIARGMYYAKLDSAPQWQRELAAQQQHDEGLIEPQIMETLAAWTYRLAGGEHLWIPRLYAILFWVLGGIPIFMLGRDLSDLRGGFVALVFYLFIQYGILASRSFQPDPLLTASIAWAYWGMTRWQQKQSWGQAIAAGLLSGLAIYVKSTAVFFIGGAWLGLVLVGLGLKKALRNPQVWVMAVLTVLPYTLYHIYATYELNLLQNQFALRFFPQMWIDPTFYLQWKAMLVKVMPLGWLLAAGVGWFLVREKSLRAMLLGSVAGYLVYGMLFSYYTGSHDYYQLPLIPLVALGVGMAAWVVFQQLRAVRWLETFIVVGVLAVFMIFEAWDARVALKRIDKRSDVDFYTEVGSLFTPNDHVISMSQSYGYPIAYWGWVNNTNWFYAGDFKLREMAGQQFDIQTFFQEQTYGKDYFLVTNFSELDRQPEIKQLLADHYPLIYKTDVYIVYDLCNPLPGK